MFLNQQFALNGAKSNCHTPAVVLDLLVRFPSLNTLSIIYVPFTTVAARLAALSGRGIAESPADICRLTLSQVDPLDIPYFNVECFFSVLSRRPRCLPFYGCQG
ncbi:hypothetical protein DSUL_20261 [Desulfovibrionales bacterium]